MPVGSQVRQPKIIQPGKGRRRWYLIAVLVPTMVLAAVGYAFDYGRNSILFDRLIAERQIMELKRQLGSLEKQVSSLGAERVKLREQVAALERASQIDREAARAVGEEIRFGQEERLKMEEELIFLRGIVSGKEDGKNLRIQNFKVEPTENKTDFRYSFTVSQMLTNEDDAKGQISITLVGKQEGKEKSFSLEELTEENISSVAMQFKYFKKFDGQLILPTGFSASNMIIDIKPINEKLSRLTETFEWFEEE